jgi:ABC-type Fe3+-hydroxamate transport system substrate-binding protein
MLHIIDQIGNQLQFTKMPKRIVSLVPSQTELLHYLGLNDAVVGITKFCVHPRQWHQNKTSIGGTKNINIELIKTLEPDLIIANKEENTKPQIEALQAFAPVYVSDVNNLTDAFAMIEAIGKMTANNDNATTLVQKIQHSFHQLKTQNLQPKTCCYLIWRDPYMTVGGDTFIHAMLQQAGFKNVFEHEKRYPTITIEHLSSINCAFVFLSSEPYPFKEKHLQELKYQIPNSKLILVDGEMFSWYGSRLIQSPAYFIKLIQGLFKSIY